MYDRCMQIADNQGILCSKTDSPECRPMCRKSRWTVMPCDFKASDPSSFYLKIRLKSRLMPNATVWGFIA